MANIKVKVLRGVMLDRKRLEPGTVLELDRENGTTLNLLASGRVELAPADAKVTPGVPEQKKEQKA